MKQKQLIAISTASFVACIGLMLWIDANRLASNDDDVTSLLPKSLLDYVAEARIKRNERAIAACTDDKCLSLSVPLLYKARRLFLNSGNQVVPQVSSAPESVIVARLNSMVRACGEKEAPHKDNKCWRNDVYGLNLPELGTLSPRIEIITNSISAEVRRLWSIDLERERIERQRLQAEQKEKERVEAEKAERERKQREYEEKFLEFTWSDRQTGELTGKAIVERARVRKYRTPWGTDTAIAVFKMFDGWGNAVINPYTGHEFHEISINCDTYQSSPDRISWGDRQYVFGYMPRALCAEAGYPRR